jgi:hypothetical protein
MNIANDQLFSAITSANHAVMVTINTTVSEALLDACADRVEKGVAIELLLSGENLEFLKKNPFLFHKCLQLVNKGASLFIAQHRAHTSLFTCIIDFSQVLDIFPDRLIIISEEKNVSEIQKKVRDFNSRKNVSEPYLVEPGDLRITLNFSDDVILMGDSLELQWSAELADRVVIQGMGDVSLYGSKSVQIEKSTIIKIGAYNARQSHIRAVKIWVSEEVKITYDIGFLSPKTHTYCSLVQTQNYPNVYGVARGNAVRLIWKVMDAGDVVVFPFNIHQHEGEYTFTPAHTMKIEIQACIQDKTLTRKIKLLIFPIPLFKDKLVHPIRTIDLQQKFTIAQQYNGLEKINASRLVWESHLQAMLQREENRYKELNKTLYKRYFDIRAKSLNLKRVNSFLFSILKRRHSHKAGILHVIQSIQDYYNKP